MAGSKSQATRQAASPTKAPPAPSRQRAASGPAPGLRGDLMALHGTLGNRAVGRLLGAGGSLPVSVGETLSRDGSPLAPGLRSAMERRVGADLGAVRVHADGASADSAKAIGAKAYASSNHVVFGPNRFAPDTPEGSRLLAHELTHVVQQRANSFAPRGPALAAPTLHPAGSPAEREASARSTTAGTAPVAHAVPTGAVMREPEGKTEEKGTFDTIIGGLIGDFNEDPALAEIAINTGVGLIPIVGEVTAARDVTANVYYMEKKTEYTSPFRWLGLVFALISLFPEIGAALKGLGKAVLKGVGEAIGPIVRLVEKVLEKLGHSEGALSFFRKIWGRAVSGGMALFGRVMTKLSSLLSDTVKFFSSRAEAFARGLARIKEAAMKLLPEAIEKAKSLIEGLLERFGAKAESEEARALERKAIGGVPPGGGPPGGGSPGTPGGWLESHEGVRSTSQVVGKDGETALIPAHRVSPTGEITQAKTPKGFKEIPILHTDEFSHTIEKHVAQSESKLAERIKLEKLSEAGSFKSLQEAERATATALQKHEKDIANWLSKVRDGDRLALEVEMAEKTGIVLEKGAAAARDGNAIKVVLEKIPNKAGHPYTIITSYPSVLKK